MKNLPEVIMAPPSQKELDARLFKVKSLMADQNLDCYVSFAPINVYYLTNFANEVHERPFILVIPRKGTPKMVAPLLELTHVRTRARCELEYVSYDEFPAPKGENWHDLYRPLIRDDARVGIESSLPVGIAARTPGDHIITDIIEEARLIKTDYEIGRNVHACRIINAGHDKLLEICRPGKLEGNIYSELSQLMMGKMLTDIPDLNFMVSKTMAGVWPPAISHDPHIVPTMNTKMETGGPHVSIVYAQIDGYGVELERTFFLEHIPEKARAPFETMMAARTLAFELAKPGVSASKIDKAVRKLISDKGYGNCILHRTGHGLGITGHEAPYLAEGYEKKLQPGMLITIEPGIYIPGLGGFRHSDSILVTDNGCISMTKAPEKLEDLVF